MTVTAIPESALQGILGVFGQTVQDILRFTDSDDSMVVLGC